MDNEYFKKIEDYINEPFPFEAELKQYFKGRSKDKLEIFDIGSCEGEDSIRFQKKFPKARVHTFEPVPSNIEKIKQNFRHFKAKGIMLNEFALSDKNGSAKFYVSSGRPDYVPHDDGWDYGNKSSSLLKPKKTKKINKWLKFKSKIKVQTMRLDTYCQENSVDQLDIIFLDVQGAELMVLKGAGDFLDKTFMIWLEVEAMELYAKQALKHDVEEFMSKNGFKRLRDDVSGGIGDQLYVNKLMLKSR